jgi:hypothetical protein
VHKARIVPAVSGPWSVSRCSSSTPRHPPSPAPKAYSVRTAPARRQRTTTPAHVNTILSPLVCRRRAGPAAPPPLVSAPRAASPQYPPVARYPDDDNTSRRASICRLGGCRLVARAAHTPPLGGRLVERVPQVVAPCWHPAVRRADERRVRGDCVLLRAVLE